MGRAPPDFDLRGNQTGGAEGHSERSILRGSHEGGGSLLQSMNQVSVITGARRAYTIRYSPIFFFPFFECFSASA